MFDKNRTKNLTTQARDAPLNGTSDCSFTPVPMIEKSGMSGGSNTEV